ncbi:MAG: sulfite exporter TauE/SafE family protein [Proteobacteria bacterium]|nr:sulfite exporter TauE/SafE family protein [Pseudomonadota bacterium]
MGEFALVPIAFLTSALAGAIGMGGGVLLIALMPGLVPASAIIPIHAITQLTSNVSRAAFGWRDIDWTLIPAVAAGSIAGAWFGAEIYSGLDLRWLPALIGGIILFITWFKLPQPKGGNQFALILLGFYQTGLGMVAGATGPLGAAVLLRHKSDRDWLVVNTAAYMSLNHGLRMVAFGLLGFAFMPWLKLIVAMAVAVTLGSWFGTKLRSTIPRKNFHFWFKLLVTVLALRMIVLSIIDLSA